MPTEKQKELPDNFKTAINYVNKELIGFTNIPESKKGKAILDSPLDAQAVYEKTVVPAIEKGELTPKKEKKPSLVKKLFSRKKDTRDDNQKLFDSVSSIDDDKLIRFIGKKYDLVEIKARRDIELDLGRLEKSDVETFVKKSLIGKGKEGVAPLTKEEVIKETQKEAEKNNGFQTDHIMESKKNFSEVIKSSKTSSGFQSKKSGSFLDSIRESDEEHKQMAK